MCIVSTCCGAEAKIEYLDIGICPDCHDHCDFEEIEEDLKSGFKN